MERELVTSRSQQSEELKLEGEEEEGFMKTRCYKVVFEYNIH